MTFLVNKESQTVKPPSSNNHQTSTMPKMEIIFRMSKSIKSRIFITASYLCSKFHIWRRPRIINIVLSEASIWTDRAVEFEFGFPFLGGCWRRSSSLDSTDTLCAALPVSIILVEVCGDEQIVKICWQIRKVGQILAWITVTHHEWTVKPVCCLPFWNNFVL